MTQDQTAEQNPAPDTAPDAAAPEATAGEGAAARIAELEAEVAKLRNDVLYAKADTENTRRRLEQQAEDRGKYAVANIAKDVLSVADNLRRALDSVPQAAREADESLAGLVTGVEMTERELLASFERYGIRKVTAQGERFDPKFHQAMMEIEDASQIEGTVVMVMQAGYTLHDRLLRPALVGVAKGGPKSGGGNVDTSV